MKEKTRTFLVVALFVLEFTGLLVALGLNIRADKHSYLECKETGAYVCTRGNGLVCSKYKYEPETTCVRHRVPWLPAKDR